MTDSEIIADSYAEAVKQLWANFYAMTISAQSPAEIQQAELRFSNGISIARQLRDRAGLILPP